MGEGRLRSNLLPIIKKKCPNCDGTGKVHVGWDKRQLELINLDGCKEEN
jgi:hypothetical protein